MRHDRKPCWASAPFAAPACPCRFNERTGPPGGGVPEIGRPPPTRTRGAAPTQPHSPAPTMFVSVTLHQPCVNGRSCSWRAASRSLMKPPALGKARFAHLINEQLRAKYKGQWVHRRAKTGAPNWAGPTAARNAAGQNLKRLLQHRGWGRRIGGIMGSAPRASTVHPPGRSLAPPAEHDRRRV